MGLRVLSDEDFDGDIVRGVLRRQPGVDIVRVQDAGLMGAMDPVVLDYAVRSGRVILTHDVNTMVKLAYARVAAGQPMPGVFAVRQSAPIGQIIEQLLLLIECSCPGEWEGRICYLPFHE